MEFDEKYFDATSSQKNIGTIGCNISVKKNDGQYTSKSEKTIALAYFMDIKIYDEAKPLKKINPREHWREAAFRTKICLSKNDREIKDTLQLLKK